MHHRRNPLESANKLTVTLSRVCFCALFPIVPISTM
jgi:hypothetical protein